MKLHEHLKDIREKDVKNSRASWTEKETTCFWVNQTLLEVNFFGYNNTVECVYFLYHLTHQVKEHQNLFRTSHLSFWDKN